MKAIVVKRLAPTNTQPARYKVSAEGVKPLIKSVHRLISPGLAAAELCYRQGWSGELVSGGLPNGDTVFCFIDSDRVTVQA